VSAPPKKYMGWNVVINDRTGRWKLVPRGHAVYDLLCFLPGCFSLEADLSLDRTFFSTASPSSSTFSSSSSRSSPPFLPPSSSDDASTPSRSTSTVSRPLTKSSSTTKRLVDSQLDRKPSVGPRTSTSEGRSSSRRLSTRSSTGRSRSRSEVSVSCPS
jgi:hypothetical protein